MTEARLVCPPTMILGSSRDAPVRKYLFVGEKMIIKIKLKLQIIS